MKSTIVNYDYGKGLRGSYVLQGPDSIGWYCWEALGNSGREESATKAMESARVWIKQNVVNTIKEGED